VERGIDVVVVLSDRAALELGGGVAQAIGLGE
jgi:hypothetical protein